MTRLHQRKLVRFIPEFMHPKKKLFRIHAIQIYPIGLSKKQNQKHVVFGSRFLREAKGQGQSTTKLSGKNRKIGLPFSLSETCDRSHNCRDFLSVIYALLADLAVCCGIRRRPYYLSSIGNKRSKGSGGMGGATKCGNMWMKVLYWRMNMRTEAYLPGRIPNT